MTIRGALLGHSTVKALMNVMMAVMNPKTIVDLPKLISISMISSKRSMSGRFTDHCLDLLLA